jgi:hypothetical protein
MLAPRYPREKPPHGRDWQARAGGRGRHVAHRVRKDWPTVAEARIGAALTCSYRAELKSCTCNCLCVAPVLSLSGTKKKEKNDDGKPPRRRKAGSAGAPAIRYPGLRHRSNFRRPSRATNRYESVGNRASMASGPTDAVTGGACSCCRTHAPWAMPRQRGWVDAEITDTLMPPTGVRNATHEGSSVHVNISLALP